MKGLNSRTHAEQHACNWRQIGGEYVKLLVTNTMLLTGAEP